MCPQCCICTVPDPSLGTFALQIRKNIELTVTLKLESLLNSQIYRETQLRATLVIALSAAHTSHFPSLIADTLGEVFLLVGSRLHFSRAPHLEEMGKKGDNRQPWHFPEEPCQNMMPL